MKPIIRYTGMIAPQEFPRAKASRSTSPAIDRLGSVAVTAIVALAVAHYVFGSSPAGAQPAPQAIEQPALPQPSVIEVPCENATPA